MSNETEAEIRRKFGEIKKRVGKHGLEYKVNCTFCRKKGKSPDDQFKLNMNPGRNMYYCYRCGSSGTLSFILSTVSRSNAVAAPRVRQVIPVNSPGFMVPLNQTPAGYNAKEYMEGRGFDTNVLSQFFGVTCCTSGFKVTDNDSLWFDATGSVVFPVFMNGQSVGWQCRVPYEPDKLEPAQCDALGIPKNPAGEYILPPKYMTPSAMDKGRVLFNYDNARRSDVVVLCEGPLDAISVGLCGVAAFGKGVSDDQFRLLKSYWKTAVLLLDPDADEDSAEFELKLRLAMPTIRVTLTGSKDAGDTSFEDIWRQILTQASAQRVDLAAQLPPHWYHARARTTTIPA